MTTVNEKLSDLQIVHAVHLLKFGNGLEKRILRLLASVEADILAKLATRLVNIEERGFDLGPTATARLNLMLLEIKGLSVNVYGKLYADLSSELEALGAVEIEFQQKALESSVIMVDYAAKAPSPQLLKSIVTERPMRGALLKPWTETKAAGTINRIEEAIRLGMVEGESIDQMVRRLRGTKANAYKDGVFTANRREASHLVRTAVSHVTNHAAQETWKASADILNGYQWKSTLDMRTSPVCQARDGEVYELGKGPVPPAHPSCRSFTSPVTKSFAELGLDPKEYGESKRASMDGQVPGQTNYQSWLKAQSDERQNKVLGSTRAKLFRSGKLDLKDFINDRGEQLTLDELRKLHPGLGG